jgi:hypothetical protein
MNQKLNQLGTGSVWTANRLETKSELAAFSACLCELKCLAGRCAPSSDYVLANRVAFRQSRELKQSLKLNQYYRQSPSLPKLKIHA